jgi:D-3-phosphoglycerate dehydrogenase
MNKISKVFIATSSFNERLENFRKISQFKFYKFLKNPLKKKLTKEQLVSLASDCEFIIAGTESYDKETIDKLKNLKCLFRMGSGIDNIDLTYLKKKKIKFLKSKITPEIAVAELIVGYILSFYRDIHANNENMKNHIWMKNMGSILNKKTVGIVGFGKVGKYLYKILKNFGVKILVHDKKKINLKNYSLEKLIKKSDIISINTSVTSNRKLFTKQKLDLCKKNCLIINTSRPEILDYNYLYKLIKKNKILGACIDVFDEEPYFGMFTKLKNVILSPHIGSYSREIRAEMEKEALKVVLNTRLREFN